MGLGNNIKKLASRLAPWAVVVSARKNATLSIAVTFDDGPHPENTPRILDTLSVHGARATFFLQGEMALRNRSLSREIISRGHQIGNHGYSHCDAKNVSTAEYVKNVVQCQSALEDIVGRELPRNFRPPFGHVTAASTIALLRKRFRFVFWSIDSCDSFIAEANALVEHVTKQQISAGSILLFHDDYIHTADALPRVIADLQGRKLKLVQLDELLSGSIKMPPNIA